jgi:hypothetical protein
MKYQNLLIIFSLLLQASECIAQENLITWKALDTFGISYSPSANFVRLQIGDLQDDQGNVAWFTDSFNKANRNREVHFKNGNQELLKLKTEAWTVLFKRTIQDVILIELDKTLEKNENYELSLNYVWCGGSFNSNNLTASFLTNNQLKELVENDYKNLSDYVVWQRPKETLFFTDSFENSKSIYKAKGDEKYLIAGAASIKKRIPKASRVKKSYDYWGYRINAVKVCFSSINLYKISAVDSVVYKHAIGQVKTKDIFTFQKFEGNAEIDSIVIRGFADTTGLNDSLNKELANKRAHFLQHKYRK